MTNDDLHELLTQARTRNEQHGITGMLLYGKANFLQLLEGNERDVDAIYSSILRDTRNRGNIVIQRKPITVRSFSQWSMAFKKVTNGEILNTPGFSTFFEKKYSSTDFTNCSETLITIFQNFKKNIE